MKILLADDHTLFREAMLHPLRQLDAEAQIFQTGTAAEALAVVEQHRDVDLVLLDLNMPGMDGLAAVMTFRDRFPDLPLVVLSASEEHHDIQAVLDAGAMGFVPKSSSTQVMLGALRLVLAGGPYVPPLLLQRAQYTIDPPSKPPIRPGVSVSTNDLTPRQAEVLEALAEGLSNKLIGRKLNLSEGTVKVHLAAIFRALDAKNRTDAVLRAQDRLATKSH
ncbi:MAG: response regulator transcription factor [Burkholderiales bacterium]